MAISFKINNHAEILQQISTIFNINHVGYPQYENSSPKDKTHFYGRHVGWPKSNQACLRIEPVPLFSWKLLHHFIWALSPLKITVTTSCRSSQTNSPLDIISHLSTAINSPWLKAVSNSTLEFQPDPWLPNVCISKDTLPEQNLAQKIFQEICKEINVTSNPSWLA